jgi:U3 small nucleolar RNA-associated protein 15
MSDGMLSVRTRSVTKKEIATVKEKSTSLVGGSYEFMLKGRTRHGNNTHYIVQRERRQKLQTYDKYLKAFKYTKALDAVIQAYRVCR